MDGPWMTILTTILGGGLILALVAWRKSASEIKHIQADTGKTEADTADVITRAAGEVTRLMEGRLCAMQLEIDGLRRENQELKDRVQELETRFDDVLAGAHILHEQLVENHIDPKFKPPERRKK